MPICRPERPNFVNGAEHDVWMLLRDQLRPEDYLLSGLRVTDEKQDHEADNVLVLPGAGVVVVEVKGGAVWRTAEQWWQHRGGEDVPIDPVAQARDTKYALRNYVDADPRWQRLGSPKVRWAHAVVLPHSGWTDDMATPDCPRWLVVDRTQLSDLAGLLWDIPTQQDNHRHVPSADEASLIVEILKGRGAGQRSQIAVTEERESETRRLTQEQAVILGAIQLLRRVDVRGGAGSGKTWLAVEQARRLARSGERVALLCYSRGLAAYLQRFVETMKRNERPAYVGTFHGLGTLWGLDTEPDDDSDFWENRLPAQMLDIAQELPPGKRYDSFVIDEAQDFADSWWPVVLATLKDQDSGGIFAFSDEGQRVFTRFGSPPVPLVPLLLDHNLRNTRQIADAFNPLAPLRMRLVGGDGPDVRFVPCTPAGALDAADDEAVRLLDEGWRYEDIALLATGSRHLVQVELQQQGQDEYWKSFWDKDEIFYGHVLGFKGLERPAVVLACNESKISDRSRERLYVGLSRARDQLVVCGDPDIIREVAGEQVLKRLGWHE